MQSSWLIWFIVLAALGAGAWWYLGQQQESSSTTPPAVSEPSTNEPSVATTTCLPADQLSKDQTIEYRDNQFFAEGATEASDTFCVPKGGKVTYTGSNLWVASDPHPIHSDLPGLDAKGAKESYSFTFDTAGEWGFHNHLRASDTGTIIVVE